MGKPKLNAVVAVVGGKKAHAAKALTDAYHVFQKTELFSGLSRTYVSHSDAPSVGDAKPPEKKNPQYDVRVVFGQLEGVLADMIDTVATQDYGNCHAKADVVVDGMVLVEGAPVSHLLYLEKQLVDWQTMVSKMPLRDGAEDWAFQPESGHFVTPIARKLVTAKLQEPIVLYNATPEHPAQTQLISRDTVVGHWDERRSSSAITRSDQEAILARIRKLCEAVKVARETANGTEIDKKRVGGPLLKYVFGGILTDASKAPDGSASSFSS